MAMNMTMEMKLNLLQVEEFCKLIKTLIKHEDSLPDEVMHALQEFHKSLEDDSINIEQAVKAVSIISINTESVDAKSIADDIRRITSSKYPIQ